MIELDHLLLRLRGDEYYLRAGFIVLTHEDHPSMNQLFSVYMRPDGTVKPSLYLERICSALEQLADELKQYEHIHLHVYFSPTTSNFLKVVIVISEISDTSHFKGFDNLNSSIWENVIPIKPQNLQRLFVETSKGYAINPKSVTQNMIENRGIEVAKSELLYVISTLDKLHKIFGYNIKFPKWSGDYLLGFDHHDYPIYTNKFRNMVCYSDESLLTQFVNQEYITDAIILSRKPAIWENLGIPVLKTDEVGLNFIQLYHTHPGIVLKTMQLFRSLLETNYRDWMLFAETMDEIISNSSIDMLSEYTMIQLCDESDSIWEGLTNQQLKLSLSTIYSHIFNLEFFNTNKATQIFQEGFWVIDISDLEPTQIAALSIFCLVLSDHGYTNSWIITNGLEVLMQSIGFDNLDKLLAYDLDLRNVILRFSLMGRPSFLKKIDLTIFDTTRCEFDIKQLEKYGIDHLQELGLPILLNPDREPTVIRISPSLGLNHANIIDKADLEREDDMTFEVDRVFDDEQATQIEEKSDKFELEEMIESTVDDVELSTDIVNMVPILMVLREYPNGLKLQQIIEKVHLDVLVPDYVLQVISLQQVKEHNGLYFLEYEGRNYLDDLEGQVIPSDDLGGITEHLSVTLSNLRVGFNKGSLAEKAEVMKDLVYLINLLTKEYGIENFYYYQAMGLLAGLAQSAQEDDIMNKRLSIKVGKLIVDITTLWDDSLQDKFEERVDDLSVESEGMDSDYAVDEEFDKIDKIYTNDPSSEQMTPDQLKELEHGVDVGGWTPLSDLYDYSIDVNIHKSINAENAKLKPDEHLFLFLLSHSVEESFYLHDLMEYRKQIPMYL
ncbi:MAG: hypothetical protein ACXADH_09450, partial [Candidatus Kariarchaeaceae archaeon]